MMRFLPFWFRAGLGCALVVCAGAGVAFPLDSDTSLSLYRWDRWSGDDLPARSVRAVVYGNDGYIWSPSYGGLIRFYGQRFEFFNPPEGFGSINLSMPMNEVYLGVQFTTQFFVLDLPANTLGVVTTEAVETTLGQGM